MLEFYPWLSSLFTYSLVLKTSRLQLRILLTVHCCCCFACICFFGLYPTRPSPFCWKQIFGCSGRGGLATRAQQKTLRRGCVAAKWENLWVRADGGWAHKVSGSARQWISQGCVSPPIYLCSTRRQTPSHLRAFVLESMFVCPRDHLTWSNILF